MTGLHERRHQSRHAALMAHALAPEDQAWLLAALPAARRSALEGLLGELRELGIPADPALLDVIEREAAPAKKVAAEASLATLSARQVRTLAELLQREGPGVAACLLAAKPWPWRGALKAAMDRDFAAQVGQAGAAAPAPALEVALCDALLRELEATPPAGPALAARHLWQRARGALRPAGWRA